MRSPTVSGDDWIEMAEQCKKEIEMTIASYKRRIEEWEN
jgi:hypothetical protein